MSTPPHTGAEPLTAALIDGTAPPAPAAAHVAMTVPLTLERQQSQFPAWIGMVAASDVGAALVDVPAAVDGPEHSIIAM